MPVDFTAIPNQPAPTFQPQQQAALTNVDHWFKNKTAPFYYLGGYAGTGKTFLARYLAEGINGKVQFAAYTGKAALQLKKAGASNASTVHSLTYKLVGQDEERIKELENERKKTDDAELSRALTRELRDLKKPQFVLNNESPLSAAKLLVLDECSMVNEEMAKDLLSFQVPILVLGDPGQLPPVKGEGYFTGGTPDTMLTDIRRQAKDNPIIALSMAVREHGSIPIHFSETAGRFAASGCTDEALTSASQILTGKNLTRRNGNRYLRKLLGYTSPYPQQGDKLIALRNDKKLGIFNGLMFEVLADADYEEMVDKTAANYQLFLDLESELGREYTGLECLSGHFDEYTNPGVLEQIPYWMMKGRQQLDYAYNITVHKAQGSQFDDVILIDDGLYNWGSKFKMSRKQWLYTAVTRAVDTFKCFERRQ